jgi:hypothetical protein
MKKITLIGLFFLISIHATDYYPLEEYGDLLYNKLYTYVNTKVLVTSKDVRLYLLQDQCLKIVADAKTKGFTRINVLKCTFGSAAQDRPQVKAILEALSDELLEHRKIQDALFWTSLSCGGTGVLLSIGSLCYTGWLYNLVKNY